jgi:hypothetical protein
MSVVGHALKACIDLFADLSSSPSAANKISGCDVIS